MPAPFNLYQFFRFMLPGGYIVLLSTLYLRLFFDISVPTQSLSSQSVIYFFAAFILSILIDGRDIIQYGPGLFCEADYFQKNFPSRLLLKRCIDCDEKPSCKKPLNEKGLRSVWLYLFDEHIPDYTRNIALTMGYLCRTSFYFQIFSSFFFYVGIITAIAMLLLKKFPVNHYRTVPLFLLGLLFTTLAIYLSSHVVEKKDKNSVRTIIRRGLSPWRPILFIYLVLVGEKDEFETEEEKKKEEKEIEATGLWLRWSRNCEIQKEWIRINESLLKEKICKQRKGGQC